MVCKSPVIELLEQNQNYNDCVADRHLILTKVSQSKLKFV